MELGEIMSLTRNERELAACGVELKAAQEENVKIHKLLTALHEEGHRAFRLIGHPKQDWANFLQATHALGNELVLAHAQLALMREALHHALRREECVQDANVNDHIKMALSNTAGVNLIARLHLLETVVARVVQMRDLAEIAPTADNAPMLDALLKLDTGPEEFLRES